MSIFVFRLQVGLLPGLESDDLNPFTSLWSYRGISMLCYANTAKESAITDTCISFIICFIDSYF